MAKTTLIIFLIALLPGCAALPFISSAGAIRSELRLKKIESRLSETEKILDYLIQHKNLQ
jgi:hypothetical protein